MTTWDDKPNDYEHALLWIDEQNAQLAIMRGALDNERNRAVEECAKAVDELAAKAKNDDYYCYEYAAAVIRKLKDKA